jgi:dTDP-4-dehydrorhamnose 3,5-epimerase
MIFTPAPISGAYVIEIQRHSDDRGFFSRTYCDQEFRDQGIPFRVVQANVGYSHGKGTLRGLHYQVPPHEEAKLVRCLRGAIFDVILDLREGSPSYGRWFGVELTAQARNMLLVPRGTAHGYQTLEDDTEIIYLVSEFYTAGAERGIRWNDPAFDIQWPLKENLIISDKDRSWPDFVLET